jgi:hypothetical protein
MMQRKNNLDWTENAMSREQIERNEQCVRLERMRNVCSSALVSAKRGNDRLALSAQLIQIEIALALNNANEILEIIESKLPQENVLLFDPSNPKRLTRKG